MEEDICLRNNEAVRERRSHVSRTPTAVVSEVFKFLNEDPAAAVDNDDELTMSDGEVDRLFSNLDVGTKSCDGVNPEDFVNSNLLYSHNDREKFLAEFKSKDSGFASLERQRCEPSSLYDSFLENEDDTEDAIESISSNDINASISESFYDDVELSVVPRSISMEAKSTCVDDETENAIASSAEQFATELESSYPGSNPASLTDNESYDVEMGKSCIPPKKETHITVIMVKKPSVGEDGDTDGRTCQRSPANFHIDVQNMPLAKDSSDVSVDLSKRENNDSPIAPFDSVLPSLVAPKEGANVFDFIVNPDKTSPSSRQVQDGAMDSSFISTKGVSCSVSYNFDGTFSFGETVDNTGEETNTTGAAISSVSSDDGDDGNEDDTTKDSEYAASVSYQAYDTIDAVSPASNLKKEGGPALEDSLICRGEFLPSLSPTDEDSEVSPASDLKKDGDPTPEDSLICKGEFLPPSLSLSNEDAEVQIAQPINGSLSEMSPASVLRKHKLEKNPAAEMASDDSSDEDVGIYAESFRRSNWVRVSQQGKLAMPDASLSQAARSASFPLVLEPSTSGCVSTESTDAEVPFSPAVDEVFADLHSPPSHAKVTHKRSDSMTTTASESEFKCQYVSRRKCLIQRADSQQEYHRLSSRVYDQDKQVIVHRTSESEDLGLHLLDSHPAYITSVDPGSPAEKAGITEGQILVTVNDQTVLTTDHADIVQLIHSLTGDIKLGVANSDFQPVRDLQATVISGYMHKLGNSTFRIWKKRYFLLRQDNCLYYYKNEQETDPLGAVPLGGYTISRHTETSKDFCFKAEKYGGRTYYFVADNRDQMTEWVGALTEAAARSKKRKESFLSVSSHNVGLPALHIMKPECAGFLGKLSPSKRTWRRRYCILKDACVYYYKDKTSVSALGVAHLHGYTVDVENFQRRKFSFSLQPPEKKMRVFCFSSDNETDKKRWVESLIHSIQRWVRIDKEVEC
ncbi:hypothetical protein BsWGS_24264 [Bradybaena similaris]